MFGVNHIFPLYFKISLLYINDIICNCLIKIQIFFHSFFILFRFSLFIFTHPSVFTKYFMPELFYYFFIHCRHVAQSFTRGASHSSSLLLMFGFCTLSRPQKTHITLIRFSETAFSSVALLRPFKPGAAARRSVINNAYYWVHVEDTSRRVVCRVGGAELAAPLFPAAGHDRGSAAL